MLSNARNLVVRIFRVGVSVKLILVGNGPVLDETKSGVAMSVSIMYPASYLLESRHLKDPRVQSTGSHASLLHKQ